MIEIDDIKEICFAKFAKRLQKAIQQPNDDGDVVDILLGWITDMPGVSGRNKQPINFGTTSVSNLMNRKNNIHRSIKAAGGWPDTYAAAEKHFREAVMPALNQNAVDDMLDGMRKDIETDNRIAQSKAKELVALLDRGEEAKFLAHLFLYVLTRDNGDPEKIIKKPKKEKKKSPVSSQEESAQTVPLPVLRPDTHYIVLTLPALPKDNGQKDNHIISVSVNLERLTQNNDPTIRAAFISQSDEMAKQLESLPCLFSDCGDYGEMDVPYYLEDFCPADSIVFSVGHIKDISCAKGNDYIRFRGKLQIEQQFPQRSLFLPAPHPYIEIGLSSHTSLYSTGLTIVEGDLIAGLRELDIEI